MRSISMVADPITLNRNSSADAFGSKPSEHASAEANASNSKNSKKGSNSNNSASEPPLTVVNPSSKGENGNNSRKKLNFFQRWWRGLRSDSAKEKVNEKETETEAKAKKEAAELEEKLRKDMEMNFSKSTHESVESASDDKFHAWVEKCSDPSLILAFVMFRSQQKSLSKSEEDYKQWEISQKVNKKMVSEQKEAADKAAELGRKLETPGSVAGMVKIVCYGGAAVALVAAIIAAVPAIPLIASAGAAAAIQSAGTTVGIYTTISTLATNAGQTLPPIINSGTKKEMDLNQAKVKEFDGRISSWSQKTSMCAQRMSNELQISNHLMNMIQSILQGRKDTLSALSR
jgi:hypothetical protein